MDNTTRALVEEFERWVATLHDPLQVEMIVLLDHKDEPPSAVPVGDNFEDLLTKKAKRAYRVLTVPAPLPFLWAPLAVKLQHGVDAADGARLLFLTPHIRPLNATEFYAALLINPLPPPRHARSFGLEAAAISGCVVTTSHDDIHVVLEAGYTVSHLGAFEGRLELERVGFGHNLDAQLNASRPLPSAYPFETYPSLHCAVLPAEQLRLAGGFDQTLYTYTDYARQGVVTREPSALDHFALFIGVRVTRFAFKASAVEMHIVGKLSRRARTILVRLYSYEKMGHRASRTHLDREPPRLVEESTRQRFELASPYEYLPQAFDHAGFAGGPEAFFVGNNLTEAAIDVEDAIQFVAQLAEPPLIHDDSVLWDAVIRINSPLGVHIDRRAVGQLQWRGAQPPPETATPEHAYDAWHDTRYRALETSAMVLESHLGSAAVAAALSRVRRSNEPTRAASDRSKQPPPEMDD